MMSATAILFSVGDVFQKQPVFVRVVVELTVLEKLFKVDIQPQNRYYLLRKPPENRGGVFFLKKEMDIKQQKVEMWTKKLHELEIELSAIMKRKGEAAREGDLRENAAYQMAIEDADTFRARIRDVKKILADLGVPPEDLEKEEK
jgi:hypothetical protein